MIILICGFTLFQQVRFCCFKISLRFSIQSRTKLFNNVVDFFFVYAFAVLRFLYVDVYGLQCVKLTKDVNRMRKAVLQRGYLSAVFVGYGHFCDGDVVIL